MIASACLEFRQEGKPQEAARVRIAAQRHGGGVAARGSDDFRCAHVAMLAVRAVAMDAIE